MAKVLSPLLIALRQDAAFTDGDAVEELEFDFNLGQGQGVEVMRSEAVGILGTFQPAANSISTLQMSLHRRVGTLTAPTTPTDQLQAEIMHQVNWVGVSMDATTEGMMGFIKIGDDVIHYKDIVPGNAGRGLIVVSNLTVRIALAASAATAIWNGVGFRLWYRYVQLTTAEISEAFLARQ